MLPPEIAVLGDLSHALRTAVTLVGLGIVMAVSPTTFGIEIGAVEGSTQARRRVLVIAGAVATSATLLALVFLVRPGALFAFVAAESLLSAIGPTTMYLVVNTVSAVRPAALWPLAYAVFLLGVVAPYVFLGIAITSIPSAARSLSRLLAALEHKDLRRPVAAAVILAGMLLMVVSTLGIVRAG